jgi:hypothetical protein
MNRVASRSSRSLFATSSTALLLVTLVVPTARAEEAGTDALALALARLRGEIESMSDDIQAMEAEERERRMTLAALATEASAERARADMRLSRLSEERARKSTEANTLAASEDALKPAIARVLVSLDDQMAQGLPYKTAARRAAVKEIDDGLRMGTLAPRQALLRTWALVQDEDRLTKESVLDRQVITVDGEELHADVVRLGMTALYFKTTDAKASDAKVGLFIKRDGAWKTKVLTNADDAALVRALFDAQKTQVKTGRFTLPLDVNAESAGGR